MPAIGWLATAIRGHGPLLLTARNSGSVGTLNSYGK